MLSLLLFFCSQYYALCGAAQHGEECCKVSGTHQNFTVLYVVWWCNG